MKVLHVSAGWGGVGGTESYLASLVAAQIDAGRSCFVIAETIGNSSLDVAVVRVAGLDATDAADPGAVEAFAAAVAGIRPDVIHLHNVTHPEVVERAPELAPAVSFIHDHTPFCPGLNKQYADGGLCDRPMGHYCVERYRGDRCLCLGSPEVRFVADRILRTRRLLRAHDRLAGIVVASDYMRAELERAGLPGGSITVVPLFSKTQPGPPPSAADGRVVMIGRMVHPDKGVEPLLDALTRVSKPFAARLLGDGPDLRRFERYRDGKGLAEVVSFVGRVPQPLVGAELIAARVLVVPSMWNEPFGIVGLEAMAHGRPVIAFDVGGVGQWLEHEATGLIVGRGDTEGLAGAIERVLGDDGLADRLGRVSQERVRERFTERAHVEAIDRLYVRAALQRPLRTLRTGTEG